MRGPDLKHEIEALAAQGADANPLQVHDAVSELLSGLEQGSFRAARPEGDGWKVEAWVKVGILLGFRFSEVIDYPPAGPMLFRDKSLFPTQDRDALNGVRIVPGGSAVRRGAHLAPGVVLMPPCYVNVGAYVGEGSMIDSHALVGSCAQIGSGVHLSAGAQIGGVLEPPGALPVIVEDDAFVGGLSAIVEGVHVRRRAVIGAGVVLTASTPVFDLVHEQTLRAINGVLTIPEGAVVVPGSRPLSSPWAKDMGLCASAALIVKERDERTDARATLEEALR